MTRILLDQGLAPRTATLLRECGFDAVHVAEIGMAHAEDLAILEAARNDRRICVTLDHDFHAHLATTGQAMPSVILLRVQGLDGTGQAELIRRVCVQCATLLSEGAMVSADTLAIRVRRLPLR